MPKGRRNPKARVRRRAAGREMPSCAEWFVREVVPAFRRQFPVARKSRRHLRNAAIEVLEAMKAMLDETINWLRRERPAPPEMKRIRVEG